MKYKPIKKIKRKAYVFYNGVLNAFCLNQRLIWAKFSGKKTVLFQCAETQFYHVQPVIDQLLLLPNKNIIHIAVLCDAKEKRTFDNYLSKEYPSLSAYSKLASRFVLFCDMIISVNQGMVYPLIRARFQICMFHGQPSKGNPYKAYNPKGPNIMFFYGPLMRDYYFKEKTRNPSWPEVRYFEIGQPISDKLFNNFPDKITSRKLLNINPEKITVLYAPSFEYCSSLATNGHEMIETLCALDINVIVKPHPSFYNTCISDDGFNVNIPNVKYWGEDIKKYSSRTNCVFSSENNLNVQHALGASDIMVTDFSGIAFDGILLDRNLIYWNCPLLFDEYLPNKYGLNPEEVKNDLACNVGRDAGVVVNSCKELVAAVEAYRNCSSMYSDRRKEIARQLLFNHGKATQTMVNKISELLEVN